MPKTILSQQEALEYLNNSLANAYGTGYIQSYGLEIKYDVNEYEAAKTRIKAEHMKRTGKDITVAFEDVMTEIIRGGGTLTMVDEEGGEPDYKMNLETLMQNVNGDKMPQHIISELVEENDDASTADTYLQVAFMNEIVYG